MITSKPSHTLIAFIMVFMFTGISSAQGVDKTDHTADTGNAHLLKIEESDYACFRDLNCLKNDSRKHANINFHNRPNAEYYTLSGEAENVSVFARYNQWGRLVSSRLVQTNSVLPQNIARHLVSGDYTDWRILGNEKVVLNFDARTTEYKILLQKDDEGIVLHFDHKGNQLNSFHGA